MERLLNQEEIDHLLKQLQIQKSQPSILDITQRDIDRISDIALRTQRQIQFDNVNDLYVKPLEHLYLFYCNQKGKTSRIPDLGDISIMSKISRLREVLLSVGFTGPQLADLVPKKEEEVSLLISAMKKGFKNDKMYNNENRLTAAKSYLDSMGMSEKVAEELSAKRI